MTNPQELACFFVEGELASCGQCGRRMKAPARANWLLCPNCRHPIRAVDSRTKRAAAISSLPSPHSRRGPGVRPGLQDDDDGDAGEAHEDAGRDVTTAEQREAHQVDERANVVCQSEGLPLHEEGQEGFAGLDEFLQGLGSAVASKYRGVLVDQGFTLQRLCTCKESELKAAGIAKGPRVKMLRTVHEFASAQAAAPPAETAPPATRTPPRESC